jgi:uncharacterized protein
MSTLNTGWIQTHSLLRVSPMDILSEDIRMEDIAISLSRRDRFAGHSHYRENVAQHSVLVALACPPKYRIHGLLHDVAEAYLGDIVAPLKPVLPVGMRDWITAAEIMVNVAVYSHLGIEGPDSKARAAVHLADQRALVTETSIFWDKIRPDFILPEVRVVPYAVPVFTSDHLRWDAATSKDRFLTTLQRLLAGEPITEVGGFYVDEG